MAQVVFYEKPGCINNTRQKKLLRDAGHDVIAMNLLETQWNSEKLKKHFSGLPVNEWFNQSAPAIKNGEIDLDAVTEQEALDYMTNEPLLIRRPLIEVDGLYMTGFNFIEINELIGLSENFTGDDLEQCSRNKSSK